MTKTESTTYYLQMREYAYVEMHSTLAAAIASALRGADPCDVSVDSGAIVWAWEMREEVAS